MKQPLKQVHLGRLFVGVWIVRRFWKWKPEVRRYWYGELRIIQWGMVQIGWDGRKDVLGDWMGKRR